MLYALIFIISFLIIGRSSTILTQAITNLARLFRISEYSLSFILAGIATSIPEFFIGLSSAAGGVSAFSFGEIIGANIINVSLIIGLATLISGGLKIESALSRKNFWFIFGIVFLPFLLSFDGALSRGDGAVLLMVFSFYILTAFQRKTHFTKQINKDKRELGIFKKIRKDFAAFLASAGLLLASSISLVWSGNILAGMLGIGTFIFGMIFVSIGTALPELAFGLRSALIKHGSMATGAVMGTVAFNASFILGIVSLIHPVGIAVNANFLVSAVFTFIPFLLFNIFVFTKNTISRKEGMLLLSAYIIFLILEYLAL